MNRMTIDFEYGCFPIWIYDDDGKLLINDLPWELSGEKDIDDSFIEIQNIYDSLFIVDSIEVKYIGFDNESEKANFLRLIDNAINLIKMKIGNLYVFEKKFDVKEL
ncbi:MAG: hypothetical protein WCF96_02810 [Eubacteriales bacterium]